jgi:hypothetical protein
MIGLPDDRLHGPGTRRGPGRPFPCAIQGENIESIIEYFMVECS